MLIDMYSASGELKATVRWYFELNATGPPFSSVNTPLTDMRSSKLFSQSASQYADNWFGVLLKVYFLPNVAVDFKYLNTLIAAFQCFDPGLDAKRPSWLTANATSGRVHAATYSNLPISWRYGCNS